MTIPVSSRAHRILSYMSKYHNFKETNRNPKDYPLNIQDGEIPLGVYENIPNHVEESIIITDKAIYYCNSDRDSEMAKYEDILSTETPKNKFTDDTLRVLLKNGKQFLLPIRRKYAEEKTSDLFEFIRFINRVKEDLDLEKSK